MPKLKMKHDMEKTGLTYNLNLKTDLTLRRLSTDIEDGGFCGRGTMGVLASLGRGGGSGGGGGWYQDG